MTWPACRVVEAEKQRDCCCACCCEAGADVLTVASRAERPALKAGRIELLDMVGGGGGC